MVEEESHNLTVTHDEAPLYKIVLTGGPCGGKTTALERLSNYLRERGFEVMTCPEAYTLLVTNGFTWADGGEGFPFKVQHSVMDLMISLEDGIERILRAKGKPAVILCDRGVMDGSAYMSSEDWDKFIASRGNLNSVELREGRYNAVFHLVTAAEGAEKYYTLDNNMARTETPEEARHVDSMTRNAWAGHPHLRVFDNSVDFEGKMQRLVQATAKLVGLPSEVNRRPTKFLLCKEPVLADFPNEVKYHVFDAEKVFLDVSENQVIKDNTFDNEYSYIRKRVLRGSEGASFGYTNIRKTSDGQQIELKRIITKREYNEFMKFRDKTRGVIKQTRVSFVWEMQNFNIHTYTKPVKGLCILHCQSDPSEEICLPPFLSVERKLSNTIDDEKRFGSLNISYQSEENGVDESLICH